jgi:glutathionylspermidine amidase/synthetase
MNNETEISFGIPIGKDYFNVIAYSNDEITNPNTKKYSYLRNGDKKIFCGLRYQCVEYVRRWLILNYGISFQQIDLAYKLYTLDNVKFKNIWTNNGITYTKCPNGSNTSPKVGSVLLWNKADNYPTGHVAIVSKIYDNYIYISEQNWEDILWRKPYSRKIPIKKINNKIILNDNNQYNLVILGWLNLHI